MGDFQGRSDAIVRPFKSCGSPFRLRPPIVKIGETVSLGAMSALYRLFGFRMQFPAVALRYWDNSSIARVEGVDRCSIKSCAGSK
jgi:hypothetical protein